MKKISIGIFLLTASVLLSCDGSEPSIPEVERVAAILTSTTWKVQSVNIDGVNETTSFTGLTLKFTATSYTTTNGAIVWPASGTWSFADVTAKKIDRSDGVEVTVDEVTESSLTLTFNWDKTTLGEGREHSVEGEHVFKFTK